MALLAALSVEAWALLTDALSKPIKQRVAALRATCAPLFKAVAAEFDGNAASAARQLAFHARAYPYIAGRAAFAIDGGIKRGQATYVVSVDGKGTYGVVRGVEGKPSGARVVARFTGTLAIDKARVAYAAMREGMPYVVKAHGKFAVSNNGAHVNARLVSVSEFEADGKAFDVYRATGRKGAGRAWRALDGNSGGKQTARVRRNGKAQGK